MHGYVYHGRGMPLADIEGACRLLRKCPVWALKKSGVSKAVPRLRRGLQSQPGAYRLMGAENRCSIVEVMRTVRRSRIMTVVRADAVSVGHGFREM